MWTKIQLDHFIMITNIHFINGIILKCVIHVCLIINRLYLYLLQNTKCLFPPGFKMLLNWSALNTSYKESKTRSDQITESTDRGGYNRMRPHSIFEVKTLSILNSS